MIDFTRFKIRDMETGTVLFEITKPPMPGEIATIAGEEKCHNISDWLILEKYFVA